MRCPYCNYRLEVTDRICPNCEKKNEEYRELTEEEINEIEKNKFKVEETIQNQTLGILAIVFSIIPIFNGIGLLLSIIGMFYYADKRGIKKCKIGIYIFLGYLFLNIFILFYLLKFKK